MRMYDLPDANGHFGRYGGVFVSETLIHALDELKAAYERYREDPEFLSEFAHELKHYVGRPSPVYHAKRWSQMLGGAQLRTGSVGSLAASPAKLDRNRERDLDVRGALVGPARTREGFDHGILASEDPRGCDTTACLGNASLRDQDLRRTSARELDHAVARERVTARRRRGEHDDAEG